MEGIQAKGDHAMAAMKPRTGDGPMEAVKEGRLIIVRVPLEGGGRLVVSVNDAEAAELRDALVGVVEHAQEPAVAIPDADVAFVAPRRDQGAAVRVRDGVEASDRCVEVGDARVIAESPHASALVTGGDDHAAIRCKRDVANAAATIEVAAGLGVFYAEWVSGIG